MPPANQHRPPSLGAEPAAGAEAGGPSAQERRLAAQMRALAEIAPAVAHDLRAPINAMVLNLEVLRETIGSGRAGEPAGQERLLRYVNVLREELTRLHRSLEIFLGHVSPRGDRTGTLDLREIAGDLASLLVAPARKEQIEVRATLPETQVMASFNPYLLRQALLHFGLAALAAVPRSGRLQIVLSSDDGRARLRIFGGGRVLTPKPAPAFPLERLEMARSLLAAQAGEARGLGAWCSGGPEEAEAAEGDVGFEIELPLARPEVT
jgi:signal transduction histidine kinase